jgi:hypothetical protein
MTVLAHKKAAAVLTVVHPVAPSTTRVFIDDAHHRLDPFHRAEKRRDALLAEPPGRQRPLASTSAPWMRRP